MNLKGVLGMRFYRWTVALLLLSFIFTACGEINQETIPSSAPSSTSTQGSYNNGGEPANPPGESALQIVGELKDFQDRPVRSLDPLQLSDSNAMLVIDEERTVHRYFVDYYSEYLVILDKQNRTVEPIMDLSAGFEDWNMVRVVMGSENSILILSHNELYHYRLAEGSLEPFVLAVEPDGEWPLGYLIVAVDYAPQLECYAVLLTERAADFDDQNKELILARYNALGQQTGFYHTNAYAVADFFGVWSTPSLDSGSGEASFDAFAWPFAKEHPNFFRDLSEEEKESFIALAKENYDRYTFDLSSGQLIDRSPCDPTKEVNWKFLY